MTFVLRYATGPQGWACDRHGPLAPGTIIDTSLPGFWEPIWRQPPIDAVPYDQFTYDYMTSRNGVIGMSYPYWRVAAGPGVVPFDPLQRFVPIITGPGRSGPSGG
jgi:hypothetical protein